MQRREALKLLFAGGVLPAVPADLFAFFRDSHPASGYALRTLDARGHLVDALGKLDEFVAALDRASCRKVALRDSSDRGRDLADFIHHRSPKHRGSDEADHQKDQVGEQKRLMFTPLALTGGIEPSDDLVLLVRPAAYALSYLQRAN